LELFDGSSSSVEDWDDGTNDSSVSRGDFKVKGVGQNIVI
jgi:hypothetical protein